VPKVIHVRLTDEEQNALNERARARTLAPGSANGWRWRAGPSSARPSPRIVRALDLHEQTARTYLTAFLAAGFAALPDRPAPGRPPTVTPADLDAVGPLLDASPHEGRAWTVAGSWLDRGWTVAGPWRARSRGWPVSAACASAPGGAHSGGARSRWTRTLRAVRHMQKDPSLQAAADAHRKPSILSSGCRGRSPTGAGSTRRIARSTLRRAAPAGSPGGLLHRWCDPR